VSIVWALISIKHGITGEWIDTDTGEVQRTRVAPADRAAVRKFLAPFRGQQLEVALEATTGWRFVVDPHRYQIDDLYVVLRDAGPAGAHARQLLPARGQRPVTSEDLAHRRVEAKQRKPIVDRRPCHTRASSPRIEGAESGGPAGDLTLRRGGLCETSRLSLTAHPLQTATASK
jgi:hypothetical protein